MKYPAELSRNLYHLISSAIKTEGSFDPNKIGYLFEESMTPAEYELSKTFLQWCEDNKKEFGSGNYPEVYAEFLTAMQNQKPSK